MAGQLPTDVDYRQLVASGDELDGSVPGTAFTRLGPNFRTNGDVSATVSLTPVREERTAVRGRFQAPLEGRCQRCLEWMELRLEGRFELIVQDPDAPFDLEDDEDAIELAKGKLPIWQMLEDEIVLACPMIPVHEAACGATQDHRSPRQRPFAGLRDLLESSGPKES